MSNDVGVLIISFTMAFTRRVLQLQWVGTLPAASQYIIIYRDAKTTVKFPAKEFVCET